MKKIFSKSFDPSILNRDPKWKKNIALKQKELAQLQKPFTVNISICPICETSDYKKFCTVFEYNYLSCAKCDHIFCESVVPQDKIEDFYSSTKDIKSTHDKIYIDEKLFHKRVDNIAIPKVNFVNNNLVGNHKNEIWIDIGAGVGELVYAASKSGWKSIGFDLDLELIEFAKKFKVDVRRGSFHSNFDFNILNDAKIVSFISVLEHIENPADIIFKTSKYLKKGNYILIEVPRHPSLSSFLNFFFPENSHRHIFSPDHLHIFSDNSINLMLNKYNFKIEVAWFFGQDFTELFDNLSLISPLDDLGFSGIRALSGEFQKILDKSNYSDSMIILAKKTN